MTLTFIETTSILHPIKSQVKLRGFCQIESKVYKLVTGVQIMCLEPTPLLDNKQYRNRPPWRFTLWSRLASITRVSPVSFGTVKPWTSRASGETWLTFRTWEVQTGMTSIRSFIHFVKMAVLWYLIINICFHVMSHLLARDIVTEPTCESSL